MPLLIFIIASVVVVESLFGIVKRYLYYLRMRRITCVRADIISTAAATTTSWCRRPRSFFSHCEKGASSGRPDKCFSSFFLRFLPTTFPPLFSYSLLWTTFSSFLLSILLSNKRNLHVLLMRMRSPWRRQLKHPLYCGAGWGLLLLRLSLLLNPNWQMQLKVHWLSLSLIIMNPGGNPTAACIPVCNHPHWWRGFCCCRATSDFYFNSPVCMCVCVCPQSSSWKTANANGNEIPSPQNDALSRSAVINLTWWNAAGDPFETRLHVERTVSSFRNNKRQPGKPLRVYDRWNSPTTISGHSCRCKLVKYSTCRLVRRKIREIVSNFPSSGERLLFFSPTDTFVQLSWLYSSRRTCVKALRGYDLTHSTVSRFFCQVNVIPF